MDEKYPNKEEVEKIELEEGTVVSNQLQIEDFPNLRKVNVKGS